MRKQTRLLQTTIAWGCCAMLGLVLCGCRAPAPVSIDKTPSASSTPTAAPSTAVPLTIIPPATISPAATLSPEPTAPVLPLTGIVIGIDPGHQRIYDPKLEPIAPGSDKKKQRVAGGARGVRTHTYEYEVNLSVGLLLRDQLEAAGATVYMTRTTHDVNISNKERAEFMNQHAVDLGIRLHCNRSSDAKKHGAYILIPAEHRTDWYEENLLAATCVITRYCAVTGIDMASKDGIATRGDQTGFNWCTRPTFCIEMGYMSNVNEDALLANPDFQKTMAQGLYEGILSYFCPDAAESVCPST